MQMSCMNRIYLWQGHTIMGEPDAKENLGDTEVPYEIFINYLRDLAVSSYRSAIYSTFVIFMLSNILLCVLPLMANPITGFFFNWDIIVFTGLISITYYITIATHSAMRWQSSWRVVEYLPTSQICLNSSCKRKMAISYRFLVVNFLPENIVQLRSYSASVTRYLNSKIADACSTCTLSARTSSDQYMFKFKSV